MEGPKGADTGIDAAMRSGDQPEREPRRTPTRPGLEVAWFGVRPAEATTTLYIYEDVLFALLDQLGPGKTGGLLTGSVREDQGHGWVVEVDGFDCAGPTADNTSLVQRLEGCLGEARDVGGVASVGWFHGRVAPGPAPTPQDLAIHRHLFREPWSVMLLMEPRSRRLVVYQVARDMVVAMGFGALRVAADPPL